MDDEPSIIERCAIIADQAETELKGMLGSSRARKSHYDKQTGLQIKYAIRWVTRVAQRIRALNPAPEEEIGGDGRAAEALKLLLELRPMIAKSRDTHWRTTTLAKIDQISASASSQSG